MKAQFVYENVRFERRKDPREAMRIGSEARTLDVTGIMNPNYFEYNNREITQILNQLMGKGNPYAPGNKILFTYAIDDEGEMESDYSLDELQISRDYDFIRFEGEKYPIKKDKSYLKYLEDKDLDESIKFERGKEPKEAMKIGKAHEREMISNQVRDLGGLELNKDWDNWDYDYINIKGYDAFQIKIVHPGDGFVEWMVLVPGIFCSGMYSDPEMAKTSAKWNLHGKLR